MNFQPLASDRGSCVESDDLHRRGREGPVQRGDVVQIHGARQGDRGIHLTAQVDEVVAGGLGLHGQRGAQSSSAAILTVFMDDMV